ncbi:MAG: nucleotide exchange factor GrpE [Oscillospiraceae bacterium]|jgi:Molecular chaperone GrpE (heat shock protein)|nr:nucleotide exchange factor GrpE [Oscillospiraceae bacterium]
MLAEEEKVEKETCETPQAEPEENREAEEKESAHASRKERRKKTDLRIEELEKEKEELEKKNAELSDKFLRKVAEFDNYRKRTDREKMESVSLGVASALENILPVFDSLALAAQTECSDETYKKGVDMTLQSFRSGLEKLGVKEIEALGQPFDPKFHNAVMSESVEGVQSGTVTKVLQRGFMQGDKVIRYAMVAVAE